MKITSLLALAVLLLSWILPNHYFPWVAAYQEFLAFMAALLFLCLLFFNRSTTDIKLPFLCLFIFSLACIPVLQYVTNTVYLRGDALISSVYLLGFSAMLSTGYNLAQANTLRSSLISWLASTFIIAATISIWLAIYQWLLQPSSIWIADLPPDGRPFANFAQPNQLATLLSMSLAAVLFFYEKHLLHRISSSLLALLLLFAIALTQSRTPWLMAIFFVVLWLWKFDSAQRRLPRTWAFAWVAIFVGFIFILPHLAQWLQLGGTTSVAKRAQALERWDLYVQFYQAIIHGPLWGYGWQQVSTAQLAITPLYPVAIYTEYTHNILLDLLIWNGPILGSIIIVAVSYYLLRLAFLARSAENLFVLMAVGFFLLHSMLEYPHAYAYFLLPVGLLIGILQADFPCKTWRIPRWCVLIFLIVSVGLYTVIWQEYRVIEEDYRLMRFEKNRVGTLKAEQPAPDVLLLTQLQALTKHSRLPATTHMSADELDELSRFAKRFTHPASLFKYAQALALNNQLTAAYEQLLLIQGLHGDKLLLQAIYELDTLAEEHPEIAPLLKRLHAIPLDHVKQITENTDESTP